MAPNTVLVAGALGTVGRAVIERCDETEGWRAIGLARRAADFATGATFRSVDLRDRAACEAGLGDIGDVTHIVYAAVYEKPNIAAGWRDPDHAEINLAMLRNLVEVVERASPKLRHVTLLQGTKAYGAHLGPFKVPAREREPRYWGPNFYHDQEDWLAERQQGRDWSWTILRPQIICGIAIGSWMNALACVATYCAITKAMGLPLRFPGGEPRLQEAIDSRILARAILWAGESPAAANQAFNIANGDVYVWHNLFPRFADYFGLPYDQPFPTSMPRIMVDKGPVWDRIVAQHGLAPYRLDQLVPSWQFADFVFGYGQRPNPAVVSTIKLRQAGFHDCIDTEDMFFDLFDEMKRRRLIPG